MRKLPIFAVDAFTRRSFTGNPAAVIPLEEWLPDDLLQSIANENNLSETAFFVKKGELFELRWFTPKIEVDLCGHATLAAAHVLVHHLGYTESTVRFDSGSGRLFVRRVGGLLVLDFPTRRAESSKENPALNVALGATPSALFKSRDYLAVFDRAEDIAALEPDFEKMLELDCLGVIATAPSDRHDFVYRFFAPKAGVNEDPVTGSAQCSLIPYWAERLDKLKLHARQISERGGELFCELCGDRVKIGGYALTYLVGEITV
ncbi:MAG: PhzF family phenazine biosynthesis protein [Puniceicoccaceae bacterium]|nr:MAG: PhzF family phenazine biosynthesis protein [Puniceicoccaceae bacterium]